jgi:3-phytase
MLCIPAVYERKGDNAYLASFPEVLDDGGQVRPNTNFKFIRWEDIAQSFNPPLLIDPQSWHPRQ